ncbi:MULTISPECIES: regulatory protein RecX [Kitasatospora]|uniref:Regulatory protein RecX n=1 Tax=Kitasatospora setae (strain ATCC 33774 / DSM 43861 / JCM 3304 / KCC A-0304 / NBRC 14216 / KM-6054) TaxID=452652 RepID=E4NI05_KITSK|nr:MULTISPECIES: regulatory protein RecX [Kitasatospora]BAJ31135.1 putative regulatory protein RecX [Kitasatospora setae KM-6054]
MTPHQQYDHPAPGPSGDGPGAGVHGPGPGPDDDYGPPDWFAAVAEEEPEPEPAREAAGEPPVGPVGELPGMMRASDLAGGRRRRRSALGELPAAAPEPVAAERPRARRRAKAERADGDGPGAGAGAAREGRRGRAKTEPEGDPADRARDICLRLLTGAAKSRKQLADALRRKEIPDEAAERVLDRLEEVGLIDDAAFAEAWVESRHAVRGLSRRALAQELRTKGVAGEAAERALLQVDEEDESEAARALVARKLRSTAGLARDVRIRRLVGVLARRGYPEGLAFRVVRAAIDAEGAGGEDDAGEEGDQDWQE